MSALLLLLDLVVTAPIGLRVLVLLQLGLDERTGVEFAAAEPPEDSGEGENTGEVDDGVVHLWKNRILVRAFLGGTGAGRQSMHLHSEE